MEVPKPSQLKLEQMGRVNEFIKEAILLTDEENAALDGVTEMAYEMFKRLGERLLGIGCDESYYKLLREYPDFLAQEADEIEAELELAPENFPKCSEEDTKKSWEKLCEKIRKKHGANAI